MPSGRRIRGNNVFGFITDNPLTAGAVTMNSAGLSTLPVVSSAHAIICLDPKRVFGEPEIVVVTSHSASATVATIVRGQYGTTARSHPQNTTWAHVPLDEDYTEILTSSTRPTDPYAGQMIFETDTDKFVARVAANSAWQDVVPLGAQQSYTPVWGNVTLGTGPTNIGSFMRLGRLIFWRAKLILGTGGTLTGLASVTIPVNMASEEAAGVKIGFGSVTYGDATGGTFPGLLISTGVGAYTLRVIQTDALDAFQNGTSATRPFAWTTADQIQISGIYEAAS